MPNNESVSSVSLNRNWDSAALDGDMQSVVVLDSEAKVLLSFTYNYTIKNLYDNLNPSRYLANKTAILLIENRFVSSDLQESLQKIKEFGYILWFNIKQEISPKLNIKVTIMMRPYITCYFGDSK